MPLYLLHNLYFLLLNFVSYLIRRKQNKTLFSLSKPTIESWGYYELPISLLFSLHKFSKGFSSSLYSACSHFLTSHPLLGLLWSSFDFPHQGHLWRSLRISMFPKPIANSQFLSNWPLSRITHNKLPFKTLFPLNFPQCVTVGVFLFPHWVCYRIVRS